MSPRRPLAALASALALLAPAAAAQATLKVPQDFATIAEALAAAQPGDTILVGKGVHTESLDIQTDGLTLRGKGAVLDARGSPGILAEADDLTITGLSVRNAAIGIVVDGDRASVTRCRVEGAAGLGIRVEGDDAVLADNIVSQCAGGGILYVAASAQGESRVERNTLRLNGSHGLELAAARVVVSGNRVELNGGDGIAYDTAFEPAQPAELSRNRVEGNAGDGVAVFLAPAGLVVEDNTIRRNGGTGVAAEGGQGLVVRGNKVQHNAAAGIHLTSEANLVQDNMVLENGDAGILLDDNFVGGSTVDGNVVQRNGTDGIELQGPDNAVLGNRCVQNLGDGIDVDMTVGGTSLVGNVCRRNGHEGIDNSGVATALVDNVLQQNGGASSVDGVPDVVDLAGAGNGGRGSIGESSGNVFGTGGEDVEQVLDL